MHTTSLRGAHLSPLQTRLWTFQSARKQAYIVNCVIEMRGDLQGEVLQQALTYLVERYEILRTVFRTLPGMEVPVQVIGPLPQFTLPAIDLQALSSQQQRETLKKMLQEQQELEAEIAQGTLLRLLLVHLNTRTHQLLICLPGLCADAATLYCFTRELAQAYTTILKRQPLPDNEPLQYTTFAAWQQKLMQLESAKTAHDFWGRIDLHALTSLRLPFERRRERRISHSQTPRVEDEGHHTFSLPESMLTRIEHSAEYAHVTTEAILLSCWNILLCRLLNETGLAIGVGCDGRSHEELLDLLGPCTHYLPIRQPYEPHQSLQHLFTLTQTALQQARHWQLYFTWQAPADDPAREQALNYFPLAFEYTIWPTSQVGGEMSWRPIQGSWYTEPCGLKLSCQQMGKTLSLTLSYDRQRLSDRHIQRLGHFFQTVLQHALEQPEATAGLVSLLPLKEQEQLLSQWRGKDSPLPTEGLAQLFERQAQQWPDHLAVICGEEARSYQQLNKAANRLAWQLRQQGVSVNTAVGLYVTRSVEALIGLLGILKAGGTYVPFDPGNPQVRLQKQLQQSQVTLILSQRHLRAHLQEYVKTPILIIEDLLQQVASEENLGQLSQGQDIAYILFTSGSTAEPKGVMVRQQSVVNYVESICRELQPEPGWHFATVSTLAADLGNTAIFAALASGGCIQILDYATLTSPSAFLSWIEQHPIDVLKIVPSHLAALLSQQGKAAAFLPQRALILGGEALAEHLLAQLWSLKRDCAIYNHYGPTEATIGVLIKRLDPQEVAEMGITLGRPLTNCQIYVLNAAQQLAAEEEIGELFIGGAGLAVGYLGLGAQTGEAFIPDPFSGRLGERLYRTGDLVRVRTHGELEFIGRRDTQVKLRGYRIEPGEIEEILQRHPQVWNAVAILQNTGEQEAQLIAYIVPRQPGITVAELRDYARSQLPEYMVPALIAVLKELPLTSNGKVDRRQLSTGELARISLLAESNVEQETAAQVLPRDMIELHLLQIWEEILQRKGISITENFFDLGGHSILALRMMARILTQMGRDIPLATLFLYPTIAELAPLLRQQSAAIQQSALVMLQAGSSHYPFFCVHPSGGIAANFLKIATYLGPSQPFYGLQSSGNNEVEEQLHTLEDLAAYYLTEMQAKQPQGPYLLGGWSMGGVVALEMAQQLQTQGHEVALLAVFDSRLATEQMRRRIHQEQPELTDREFARLMVTHLGITLPDDFHQIPQNEHIQYVFELAKRENGIPIDFGLQQVRRIFQMIKKHTRMAHLYIPHHYPGPIDYFISSDETLSEAKIEAPKDPREASVLQDWYALAKGNLRVHPIPGSHREMVQEPHVQDLAQALRFCIDKASMSSN